MGHGQSRAAFYSRSCISPLLIVPSAGSAPHDIRRGDAIFMTVLDGTTDMNAFVPYLVASPPSGAADYAARIS